MNTYLHQVTESTCLSFCILLKCVIQFLTVFGGDWEVYVSFSLWNPMRKLGVSWCTPMCVILCISNSYQHWDAWQCWVPVNVRLCSIQSRIPTDIRLLSISRTVATVWNGFLWSRYLTNTPIRVSSITQWDSALVSLQRRGLNISNPDIM